MPLSSGTRLGPYEIQSAIGAGGMGEVYKARDTRLDRTVAIKVLPSEVASDPDLRARFEREARAIAALDHPHICAIYDVGEAANPDSPIPNPDPIRYLVMQHLDGETLAARLARANGPLPLDQALKIAIEIADALDKAHRAGITHRDLKPANIMLTKSGAKLLDFGLAKLRGPAAPISMSGMTRLATTTPNTAHGTILGTVYYMAPEQVEGKEADARSDIWALGAVIYEMATGKRAFDGDSPASIIGAILRDTPQSISARQPLSPPMLDSIVGRCLEKNPDDRWQSVEDLRHALGWIREGLIPVAADRGQRAARARLSLVGMSVLLILVVAMVPGWLTHLRERAPDVVRLSILPPPNATFSSPPASIVAPQVAMSPDGRILAFIAEMQRGRPSLWIRPLGALAAQSLPETDDAIYPFWSPDSRSIGFFARGKLKTIDIAGGRPKTLSDAPLDSRGGTWNRDGTILFSPAATDALYRIAATGGPATPATRFDASRAENSHRFPSFLPDGRHFLYTTRSERPEYWGVSIASLDSPAGTHIIDNTDWSAQFVPPGYILFLRGSTLMAQAFDVDRLAVTGEAIAVAQAVGATATAYAAFSASQTGIVAYAKQIGLRGELRWFDRTGMALDSVAPPAEYLDFELSPDEQTLAVSRLDPEPNTADIWLLDLVRGIMSRFTLDRANDASAMWSPDGSRIVFRSNRRGTSDILEKRASGAGVEVPVLRTSSNLIASDWSVDGRYIVYTDTKSATGFDIWVWPTFGDKKPILAVRTSLSAMHGRLSPNGRWIAYTSDEFGEPQVYVQPFPATGDKKQISSDGGAEPRWRRDGRELFYLASNRQLMSVAMPDGAAFKAGVPKVLFQTRVPLTGNPYRTNYAVTANGQRFIVNTRVEEAMSPITVVLNWSAGLK